MNRNKKLSSNNNWIGPDGTESGPDVPEDWYLTYDGPKPIVEEIYEPNYSVDRGNGAIPIAFYINKWGIPDGFGDTELERRVFLPNEYHWRAIQDEISSKHFPGHSNCGLWPTFGNRTSVAFGMRNHTKRPYSMDIRCLPPPKSKAYLWQLLEPPRD